MTRSKALEVVRTLLLKPTTCIEAIEEFGISKSAFYRIIEDLVDAGWDIHQGENNAYFIPISKRDINSRVCVDCNKLKPLTEYARAAGLALGRNYTCKPCHSIRVLKYYKKKGNPGHPEKPPQQI